MSRIRGAKNFYTADVETNTASTYEAGTPEKTERIISISIDTTQESETLYSDDEVEEDVDGVVEKTGKVQLNYLSNATKVKLLGGSIDANGVYFPPEDNAAKKHKAIGFEADTGAGKRMLVWYYDVVFNLPSFQAETAEGKPKTQTVELEFKSYKCKKLGKHFASLDENGTTANKVTADKWFTSVYSSIATTAATETEISNT